MRRPMRLAMRWIGLVAVLMSARGAAGEVYFRDSTVEVSGSGMRSSRSCSAVLLPARTLGDAQAPRLTLSTDGLARLSFGIENPAQYASTALVQNNARLPFGGGANAMPQQFLASDVGKAIKSQRLFFVTARRTDTGKFVSSRYERIDFDAILRRVEANCPFDAEALMSDMFERERAERALAVSQSDLKLIRWALNKRYGSSTGAPEARDTLLPAERAYLKRYAAENGLPASQYLTADVARKLTSEGAELARLTPPPPPKATLWNSVAGSVWKVKGRVMTAIGYSGLLPSAEEAKLVAERKCREAGGQNCQAKGPWNFGCVYITVGHNNSQAGWASGDTAEAAMAKCRGMGFDCKPPIGGCVE